MKRHLKILLYGCLSLVGLCLSAAIGFRLWLKYQYDLPTEQRVLQEFANHRADYIHFVTLLQKDSTANPIGGGVHIDGTHPRQTPEYRNLIRKIGAKDVLLREDGSVEFALYGFGCTICSDSYIGVRYMPKIRKAADSGGWEQTEVTSLDSANLPHEHGAVATGLYVVPIEPDWFIYRLEYQE